MRAIVARYSEWFVGFVLFVILVAVIVLGLQIDRRTDAIAEIDASARRIEVAALHTEEVLVEIVDAQRTPEAVAQQQAIREALAQIRQIHALLCRTPEFVDAEECR